MNDTEFMLWLSIICSALGSIACVTVFITVFVASYKKFRKKFTEKDKFLSLIVISVSLVLTIVFQITANYLSHIYNYE